MPPPALPASAIIVPTPPGALPPQIQDMLDENIRALKAFPMNPPHTIQRLAELVIEPRRYYRFAAPWLNAVDRIVHVTSGANLYPLPPAIPDMSHMALANGLSEKEKAKGLAINVAWNNMPASAASTLGTDEALGGALLSPIPWLSKTISPVEQSPGQHAEIRTENTETIDGPNGMGRIETVSVSVNGIPSAGSGSMDQRPLTQGEILRQEQKAGVVPVTQLARSAEDMEDEEEEVPHARGPEEIGAEDLGPQSVTTTFVGGPGVEMQGIDVEAAVGRRADGHEDALDEQAETVSEAGSKREAEGDLDGTSPKKLKEDLGEGDTVSIGQDEAASSETAVTEDPAGGDAQT
jgi:hypothetical protein